MWIEGSAGTGKTALLRRVVSGFGELFDVMWSEADEPSTEVSLSLLSQFAPVDASGPFAAGLALIDRIGPMQERSAVALVAEDIHWADAASRAALLTVARRLRHDRVVMLLTSRPATVVDDWDRFIRDPDRCLRVVLDGFDDAEVGELAARHGVALTASQAARLRQHTGGHPLHACTLLTELTPEQLQAPTGDLPAPRSLAAATVASLAALSPASRSLASGLAVLGSRTPLAIVAAVSDVEQPAAALEPLLGTGLVRWSPGEDRTPVEFTHPLHRTAVYEDLPPQRRRELHLRSAEVTRWGASWAHRVAAADTCDDDLAGELDAGARYEIDRQELSRAATYLSWAATLSSSRERGEERLLRGVRLLLIDGQTVRAAALYPRVEQCARSGLRDLVIGMLAFAQANAAEAERWLRGVADLPSPRWVHAEALGQLALLHTLHGRGPAVVKSADAALALRPFDDPKIDRDVWWATAVGTAMVAGAPAGLDRLDERLSAPPAQVDAADAELLVVRGILRGFAGRTTEGVVDLRAAIELARRGATFAQLPRAHLALCRGLFNAGYWDEAQTQARTALSLMDEHHVWMRRQAEATLSPVLAARGQIELAEQYALDAMTVAAELGTIEIDGAARHAMAAVAQARGDAPGVIEALTPLAVGGTVPSVAPMTMLVWWPMLIVATIEAGDLGLAAQQIEHFEVAGTAAALEIGAQVAGLRARLAVARHDPDEAVTLFEVAISSLDPDHPVLDRALLHQAYGRLLRARGGRRSAHDQLRTAHELFDRLGAEPYRRSVATDLAESTSRKDPGSLRSPLALTTREHDVVALVNKGFTNREVGAQLYISAKAVEYHLGNVYGKLGVRSRRQLRETMPTT